MVQAAGRLAAGGLYFQLRRESLAGIERPSPLLGLAETARHDGAVLVLLFTDFLAIPLASERFFDALLFAGFQIEGVALDLLDDVFGLNFALKTAQGILKGFAFLNSNLCQGKTPPNSPNKGTSQDTAFRWSLIDKSLKKEESREFLVAERKVDSDLHGIGDRVLKGRGGEIGTQVACIQLLGEDCLGRAMAAGGCGVKSAA